MKILFPQHAQVEYDNLLEIWQRRWIYVLLDPHTNEIRYVGQTTNNPRARMVDHVGRAHKRDTPTRVWIQELLDNGDSPIMQVVGVYGHARDTRKLTGQSELEWMKRLIADGCSLTNSDHAFRSVLGEWMKEQTDFGQYQD